MFFITVEQRGSDNLEATTWKRQLGSDNAKRQRGSDNVEATMSKRQRGSDNVEATTWKRQCGSDNMEATTWKRQRGSENLEATTWKRQRGRGGRGGLGSQYHKILNFNSTSYKTNTALSESLTISESLTTHSPPLGLTRQHGSDNLEVTKCKRQSASDNLEATSCDAYGLPYKHVCLSLGWSCRRHFTWHRNRGFFGKFIESCGGYHSVFTRGNQQAMRHWKDLWVMTLMTLEAYEIFRWQNLIKYPSEFYEEHPYTEGVFTYEGRGKLFSKLCALGAEHHWR